MATWAVSRHRATETIGRQRIARARAAHSLCCFRCALVAASPARVPTTGWVTHLAKAFCSTSTILATTSSLGTQTPSLCRARAQTSRCPCTLVMTLGASIAVRVVPSGRMDLRGCLGSQACSTRVCIQLSMMASSLISAKPAFGSTTRAHRRTPVPGRAARR